MSASHGHSLLGGDHTFASCMGRRRPGSHGRTRPAGLWRASPHGAPLSAARKSRQYPAAHRSGQRGLPALGGRQQCDLGRPRPLLRRFRPDDASHPGGCGASPRHRQARRRRRTPRSERVDRRHSRSRPPTRRPGRSPGFPCPTRSAQSACRRNALLRRPHRRGDRRSSQDLRRPVSCGTGNWRVPG